MRCKSWDDIEMVKGQGRCIICGEIAQGGDIIEEQSYSLCSEDCRNELHTLYTSFALANQEFKFN